MSGTALATGVAANPGFDLAHVHLLTTATLPTLQGASPQAAIHTGLVRRHGTVRLAE